MRLARLTDLSERFGPNQCVAEPCYGFPALLPQYCGRIRVCGSPSATSLSLDALIKLLLFPITARVSSTSIAVVTKHAIQAFDANCWWLLRKRMAPCLTVDLRTKKRNWAELLMRHISLCLPSYSMFLPRAHN